MNKAYRRIEWVNNEVPINESNLNRMDVALDEIDSRVVNMDRTLSFQSESMKQAVEAATTAQEAKEIAIEAAEQAKTYMENAEAIAGVGIATKDKAGLVKAEDILIEEDGTLRMIAATTETTMLNSHEGRFLFKKIKGVGEQKQYSGKNQLPYPYDMTTTISNGITWTDFGDGTVMANGTATADSAFNCQKRNDTKTPFILPEETYILSGCPSGGNVNTYRLIVGRSNPSTGAYENFATDTGNGATFTLTEESTTTQIQLMVKNGTTVNNMLFKPMLRRADITDDTWEPYVGGISSPSPSYEQEVKSSLISEISTHNKNIIDRYRSATPTRAEQSNLTASTVTLTRNVDSTQSVSYHTRRYDNFPAGTYTASCKMTASGVIGFRAYNFDTGAYKAIASSPSENKESSVTAKFEQSLIDEGFTQLIVRFDMDSLNNGDSITFYDMQLEKGEVKTEFAEPKSSAIALSQPIELNRIEVSISDDYTYEKEGKYYVADTIEKIDGEYNKVQRIGERVYDGINHKASYYSSMPSGLPVKQLNLQSDGFKEYGKSVTYLLSDKFIASTTRNENTMFLFYNSGTSIPVIFLNVDTPFTTLDEANVWLQNNNVLIQYELEEPIITPLPTADQIALNSHETYDGITYLEFDSEIKPEFEGEYGSSKVGGYTLEGMLAGRNSELLEKSNAERITALEATVVNNI